MLLTRTPLYSGLLPFTFDLHVLGTPPAFALSQDQTLMFNLFVRYPFGQQQLNLPASSPKPRRVRFKETICIHLLNALSDLELVSPLQDRLEITQI